jgi:DNA-binding CsgD family transcriptional regulator
MARRGRPPHPELLTPRQQEVLSLVREGLSNREIAERLDITLDGAKFHVSEILTKIGVTSRDEAARWSPRRQVASLHGRLPRWHSGRRAARPQQAGSPVLRATGGVACPTRGMGRLPRIIKVASGDHQHRKLAVA